MSKRSSSIPLLCVALCALLFACGAPAPPVQETPAPPTATVTTEAHSGPQVILMKDGGRMEGRMVNGNREGEWTSRHANGRLWSRSTYVNGLEEGPTEVFHPNGKPYYTGQYLHGRPIGEWVYHDSTGTEVQRVMHDSTGAVVR